MGRSKRNKKNKNNVEYQLKAEKRKATKAERNAIKQQLRRDAKRQKILSKMEKLSIIGVYCDLRKGGKYHINLGSSSKYIGSFDTNPMYDLFILNNGSFCGLKEKGTNSVVIEVYEVDEKILGYIDNYNSYNEDLPDEENLFIRKTIDSPYGKIETWFYNGDTSKVQAIENGDWLDYKNTTIKTTPPSETLKKEINAVEEEVAKEFENKTITHTETKESVDNNQNE